MSKDDVFNPDRRHCDTSCGPIKGLKAAIEAQGKLMCAKINGLKWPIRIAVTLCILAAGASIDGNIRATSKADVVNTKVSSHIGSMKVEISEIKKGANKVEIKVEDYRKDAIKAQQYMAEQIGRVAIELGKINGYLEAQGK